MAERTEHSKCVQEIVVGNHALRGVSASAGNR
jgi:hypothetical protein